MKASSLAYIPDPLPRFIQSHKFLRSLKASESFASMVRDLALLELRDNEDYYMSLQEIADYVGISRQMVHNLEIRARERHG